MQRRLCLATLLAAGTSPNQAASPPEVAPRTLTFPRDHGAHPEFRTEWWYATGWLSDGGGRQPDYGFQVTFFRTRTGLGGDNTSRFAARHLLLAHAAVTDLRQGRLHHSQRIARWSGDTTAPPAAAALETTRAHIGDWRLARQNNGSYRTEVADDPAQLAYALTLTPTQALLLQGHAGWSAKGPTREHATHYYSQPQLAVQGTLSLGGPQRTVQGRAWLDHEWGELLMPPGTVGWDWIGMNLDDGSALTAFRLRRADGTAAWAGGSFRAAGPGQAVRTFEASEVQFAPLRFWQSPTTRARYPVAWRVQTPAGEFEVQALVDAQELHDGAGTNAASPVYWEGISNLLHRGQRVGNGYLEMTGYVVPLRL